jgi:hypothetical protein
MSRAGLFNRGVTMSPGQLTPEESRDPADGEVHRNFQKWKERGMV